MNDEERFEYLNLHSQEPEADAGASAPQTPRPAVADGEYHYGPGGVTGQQAEAWRSYTVPPRQTYQAASQQTYAPQYRTNPPRPRTGGTFERPRPKKRWWIPVLLVLALAAGIAGGAFGYKYLNEREPLLAIPVETSAPVETRGAGDLREHVLTGPKEDYAAPAAIYRDNVNSVVGIANEGTSTNIWGQQSPTASSGTGFIISEDGYVLTNYHVVKGANKLTVTLYDGTSYEAAVVGYENVMCDVALLKIDATGLTPVHFGDSDELMVGEEVCTIGNPLGELTYTLTVGHLSAKERAINTDGTPISMLQTDTAINAGNSGGPLFDTAGNVVGIVTAKYSGSSYSGTSVEGLGFAIPINAVLSMLDDLQQYGYVTNRAYLGVRVADSSTVRGGNLPNGAYVNSVEPDSCAEKAGVQAGDVIVGLGKKVIGSYNDLVTALQTFTAGQTAQITIYRAGEYLSFEITFDARPQDS